MKKVLFLGIILLYFTGCTTPQELDIKPYILTEKEKNEFPVRLKILKDTNCKIGSNIYIFKKDDELGAYNLKGLLVNDIPLPEYSLSFLVDKNSRESVFSLYIVLQESGKKVFKDTIFIGVVNVNNKPIGIHTGKEAVCTSNNTIETNFYEIVH